MVNFDYAYGVWHYASYQYNHNETIRGNGLEHGLLQDTEITELQRLANWQQHGLDGNLTAYVQREGAMIRAISCRTLASRILAQFQAHLAAAQETHRLNLTFGSLEQFLTFFALSALADHELPSEKGLWVRFLYRNNTGDDAPLCFYPPFGRPHAEIALPWNEFYRSMDRIAVSDLTTWCELCGLMNMFCSSLIYDSDGSDPGPPFFISGGDSGVPLWAPVAGVIGALTTLAIFGLLATSACVFGNVRITGRNCCLGWFKAAEKMASSPDVLVAKNESTKLH
ncbi:hypothetical protein DL768_001644 [Monosporascus sp. mg162]|nr:hypothetical protein DL768_001644 [Monosporascus sp. mg162]